MKRFFALLLTALLTLPPTLLIFVAANNFTLLPWDIMHILWYGFPPLYALTAGLLYGVFHFKKGGALFFVALLFTVGIYSAHHYAMPFATELTNAPLLAVAAVFTLIGESCGRFIRKRRIKKRNAKSAPLSL
jgi:hypothetical protein